MVYMLCNGTFHLLTTNLPYHIKILRYVTVIAHSRNVDLSRPCLRFYHCKMPWRWILFFFAFMQYKCPSYLILGCRICRFFDPQEILKFDECTIYLFSRIRKKFSDKYDTLQILTTPRRVAILSSATLHRCVKKVSNIWIHVSHVFLKVNFEGFGNEYIQKSLQWMFVKIKCKSLNL